MSTTTTSVRPPTNLIERFTRRLGTALMAVGVVLGAIYWASALLDQTHRHNLLFISFALWIGAPGLVLFLSYFLLKFFGYVK